ncbi:MAG TPA: HAD family phosphatase [Blastocatellia bacterium]|jgi:HAD superfamily hydrolase (TIGR01509 family)
MLKAIIFDCDGVIADTEPLHFATLQKILAEEGILVTEQDYFDRYLALDDRGCFTRAHKDHARELSHDKLNELIRRKAVEVESVMRERLQLFPGVARFIREAALLYPLAIASGALRVELELILRYGDLTNYFQAVVSAEDVTKGKPHPEPFLKALAMINSARADEIEPRHCLVIEDSVHGVRAAREAGMLCLAVTNSYARDALSHAELVVESLEGLTLREIETLFQEE